MKLVPGDGLEPSRPELDAGILISEFTGSRLH